MRRVAIIVLAAGRSTRFGPNASKLLAPIGDATVVRRSVQAAVDAAVGDVVVVTGANAPAVASSVSGLPVRTTHADDYAEGMSASLRQGVSSVRGFVDALIIALADQPTMRAEAFRQIVSTWLATGAAIVTPRYQTSSAPSHPTLFASAVFEELLALRGDTGARAVVARDAGRVAVATMDWPAPRDIDTMDDLASVTAELSRRESGSLETDHHANKPNSRSGP